jgi:hypothetical protein
VVPNGGHGATDPDGTRRRNDFFVRWLLGVNPPDWNGGASVAATGTGGSDSFDGAPAYGFFDSPADEKPPYWWW